MSIFALRDIGHPDPFVPFYALIENGKCLLDEFFEEVNNNGGHDADLDYIQTIIVRKSKNEPISPKLFKELKRNSNDKIKDYEIRKNRLRLYVFKCNVGYVAVCGGLKTGEKDQDRDISKMRSIKNRFVENY